MVWEDFDINSLAAYLHLTPDQVKKMAERGQLPGRKLGEGWKFSPAEIHHWLEDKIGVSSEKELVEVEQVLERNLDHRQLGDIKLAELLKLEDISIPLVARTKNSVIVKMCELAAESGSLWLPEKMSQAIRTREELHPTALENGVALLHPRRPLTDAFAESFLALGITSSGIPFGGPRGVLTDIFFLIASADEAAHLRILARLSRLIQVDSLTDSLRAAGEPKQAWKIIETADEELN
jgi:PTS system nitrogen regulatory IIA component